METKNTVKCVNPTGFRPFVGSIEIPMMSGPEWAEFVRDVKERGIIEPVHVAADGVTVLDGRHRLKAAQEVGLAEIPTVTAQLQGLTEQEYALRAAIRRRNLTRGQRAFLARALEKQMAESSKEERARKGGRAKARKTSGAETSCSEATLSTEKAPTVRVRTQAARIAGSTDRDARKAGDLERGAPDAAEAVKRGGKDLGEAHREMRQQKKNASSPVVAKSGNSYVRPGVMVKVPNGVRKSGDYVGELIAVVGEKRLLTAWRLLNGDSAGTFVTWAADLNSTDEPVPNASEAGRLAIALQGDGVTEIDLAKQIGGRCILTIAVKPWGAVVTALKHLDESCQLDEIGSAKSMTVLATVVPTEEAKPRTVKVKVWPE